MIRALVLVALVFSVLAEAAQRPNEVVQVLRQGVQADWSNNSAGNRLSPYQRDLIREFSRQQLPEANRNTQVVFYPFGGPDVIFPSLFFPNMRTLVLVGLERPGHLPNSGAAKIAEVRKAYRALFSYGYYITSAMSHDLREFGTTTMIGVGLSLLGHTVTSVEPFTLGRSAGVRVSYQHGQAGDLREVYYIQQDLSDGNMSPDFVNFISSRGLTTTFYKASSYVPHAESSFSKVNALALQARYFVQSDTGLRIGNFQRRGGWDVNLFGQYATPHKQFGVSVQRELVAAYGHAICSSRDALAERQFAAIWSQAACRFPLGHDGSVRYRGALPFNYDYAGKLSPASIRGFSSSLIYAVRR
jgi:hypothetical protein